MMTRMVLTAIVSAAALAGCAAKAEKTPEEKSYTLTAAINPAAPKRSEPSQWTLTITPKAPWVLKTTTPLTTVLKPSSAVKVDKSPLKAEDIVDPNSEAKSVRTGFVATAGGQHVIAAELTFFLCTDEICQRHQDAITVRFAVP